MPGDIVEEVDGRRLRGRSGWAESFEIAFPGDRRELVLRRGRTRVEAVLTLVARASWAAATVGPRVEIAVLGIEVQNLAADDAAQHRIDSGVQVTATGRRSYFAQGDVLIELNGVRIKAISDVVRAVEIVEQQRSLNAVFIRQGETRRIIHNW
jgi:S1-C subfamily serine protease